MPILCEFDTEAVDPLNKLRPDTRKRLLFPRPLVAPPRLAHGLRLLDIDKSADIRIKATNQGITETWVDCNITSWADTTHYRAAEHVFVIPPAKIQYLTGEHMRKTIDPASVRVNFERPFVTPPKVITFLNHVDLDKNHNWRLKTSATDIDEDGFTLNIETWGDTILNAAQACWIAHPEDELHIFSMSANTTDVPPSSQPQPHQSRKITFNNVKFFKVPSVFVALNSFDIDCNANLRINAYVDRVSKTGLVWHIDTWSDTILYSAGASIIAFID